MGQEVDSLKPAGRVLVATGAACSACGAAAGVGEHCGQCGAALSRRCPACAADNPPDHHYCGECGARLGADSPEPTRPSGGVAEERRWASIVFADLSGFTAVAEQLDPEDVKELAQACVAQFSATVARFGGSVIRELGDEVLAVFGVPLAHEDDAERAVRAALAMRDGAPIDVAGAQLQVHIGINTGEVMAGLVGGAERRDYTVHGDTVNTAARLRSAAAPATVLVGEETYRATRRVVRYRCAPPVQVKGKERPVEAWEALEVAPVPEARPLGTAPLIGRDHELALLGDVWLKVTREAQPHLVTVLGEPGIGKSRLVAEFERRGLGEATVLHGRCPPYGEVLGYWALASALKEAAGVSSEDDASQARARLEGLVVGVLEPEGQADEAAEIARHLALLGGLDLAADRVEELATQHVLHVSARRFLEALARRHPTCLLLEDIHWADDALLDLVEFVAARAVDVPLLIVAQARPELLEKRPTWGRGVRAFASRSSSPSAQVTYPSWCWLCVGLTASARAWWSRSATLQVATRSSLRSWWPRWPSVVSSAMGSPPCSNL